MTGLTRRARRGWRLLAGGAATVTAGLGLLMLACVLVAMAGPRAGQMMQTNALRTEIARAAPGTTTILASYQYAGAQPGLGLPSVRGLTQIGAELRSALAGLPLARPRTDLAASASQFTRVTDTAPALAGAGAQLELVYAAQLAGHSRIVSGALPGPVSRSDSKKLGIYYYFPIAVTVATAHRFGLTVGTQLPIGVPTGASYHAVLQVTGIINPVRPAGPFWSADPTQYQPSLVTPMNGPPYWQGGAFLSGAELPKVTTVLGLLNGSARWVLPLNVSSLTASQGRALATTLPAALSQDGNNLQPYPLAVTLYSPLSALLADFVQQANSVGSLLSLLAVSLTAICATVLLLAVWLLAEQRDGEFTTLQARGASRRQLAWLALRGCLLPGLGGAVIGAATAIILTPGNGDGLSWWLTAVTVLSVLAGLPALTVLRYRGRAISTQRSDRAVRGKPAARRLVVEAVLVLGSAGGLVTLRSQGLVPGSVDAYPSLAPVLIAIPVAVVVLRCYPPLVRPVLRLTGRRRGLTAFVGLARAVRTSVAAALPVFALVLALTLVAFAGMVRAAVQRGDVAASWQQVGADAIVRTAGTISSQAQRAIAGVPGVRQTAALGVTGGTYPGQATSFGVVLADPAQYAALLAGMPGASAQAAALSSAAAAGPGHRAASGASASSPAPVLATAQVALRLQKPDAHIDVGGGQQNVHVKLVGQIAPVEDIAALAGAQYVVLPTSALGRYAPTPGILLVEGAGLNQRDLARVVAKYVPGATLSFRAPVLASLLNAPLQHGANVAFALGSAEAGVLSLLVLLITLVIGGRPRELTLARLATMGMSTGQGRALVILEAIPQILAAVIGGVACAALLAPLVGPSLNLSSFTGTAASVPVRIAPAYLAGACVGLVLLAILTLGVQTRIAIRSTASALRIGD